jgi:uncharacterized protein (TIGR03437 family)
MALTTMHANLLRPTYWAWILPLCALRLFAVQPVTIPVTPLAFEPNVGEMGAEVKFLAHTPKAVVRMTTEGITLGGVKMRFEGGSRNAHIDGEERLPGISNYFIGNDRRQWHTDVPHFGKVRWRDVYPGVDVVLYGNPDQLEYDFVLRPGADASQIQLAFDGIEELRVDKGDLVAKTTAGELRNRAPAVLQEGQRVGGKWVQHGASRAGFALDKYDHSRPLTIDPVLTYATFLGGSIEQQINGVAFDSQGNILVAGLTTSYADFPTKTPLYSAPGAGANGANTQASFAFVAKFNPAASGNASLVYSTYFATGGSIITGSKAKAVAVDASGNAYFAGVTGDGLPLQNPLQGQAAYANDGMCAQSEPTQGAGTSSCIHGFIAEISPAGNQLLFSTYLGGSDDDGIYGLVLDNAGNIYATGYTKSRDFPVAGNYVLGLPRGLENPNAFVVKVAPGTPTRTLVYSTFFGSTQVTYGEAIAADASGNIYICGTVDGTGLPVTTGAFQSVYLPTAAQTDTGFVAVFNPGNSFSLVYSSYLGGTDDNYTNLNGIATDGKGNIYVAGVSASETYPVTPSAIRGPTTVGNPKAIVTVLNPSLQGSAQLVYSSIVDGGYTSAAYAIALDAQGKIWLTGVTTSPNFPVTSNAFEPDYFGKVDANGNYSETGFLAQIDPTQSGSASLLYGSFAGGTAAGVFSAITINSAGNTLAAGGIMSDPLTPVSPSAYQSKIATGSAPAYLAVFDLTQTGPLMTQIENGASLSQETSNQLSPGLIFTIKGTGLGPAVGTLGTFDSTGKVATGYEGVQVLVNGIPCPLLYLSATQINAIAPFEIANQVGNPASIQVVYNGVLGSLVYRLVSATTPGIFSFDDGSGQGAILNQDSSVNGPNNPASRGAIVQIFATGAGQTNPPGVDGAVANEPLGQIPVPVAPISLTIGGIAVATPLPYAGTLPGGVAGALQINAVVPPNAPTGSAVPVVLTIGASSSPMTLTMAVQ